MLSWSSKREICLTASVAGFVGIICLKSNAIQFSNLQLQDKNKSFMIHHSALN